MRRIQRGMLRVIEPEVALLLRQFLDVHYFVRLFTAKYGLNYLGIP